MVSQGIPTVSVNSFDSDQCLPSADAYARFCCDDICTTEYVHFFFLQAEVAKVVETQTGLERQLELIETHQREVCVSAKFLYVSFTLIDCSFILRSVLLFLSLFL